MIIIDGQVRRSVLSRIWIFIDLTKFLDTVKREAVWVILFQLWCLVKSVSFLHHFHDNMTGQIFSGGELLEYFNISSGVKQGWMLAPVLFNMFFTCSLSHAFRDSDLSRVHLWSRLDGSMFNLHQLSTKTRLQKSSPLKHYLPMCVPLWSTSSLTFSWSGTK